MSRSPLAYPLNRGADTDVGGAADLQTDIMRFMAILSMCLLAIFALVQSIPLAPVEPQREPEIAPEPVGVPSDPIAAEAAPTAPEPVIAPEPERAIVLTRPKWESTFNPIDRQPIAAEAATTTPEPAIEAEAAPGITYRAHP